jgi:hypothetical protein
MSNMELGDLQREVSAAWQKPYVRLHGLDGFQISKSYKIGIKKITHDQPRKIANAVKYEITDEIIDYLRPSVERGNQRALETALFNAKPRHYNMWLEFRDPYSTQNGLVAWHITTMLSVMTDRGWSGSRQPYLGTPPRQWSKKVDPGDCFSFERYYEVTHDHVQIDKQRRRDDGSLTDKSRSKVQPLVGMDSHSLTTDIWSEQGPIMSWDHHNERQIASDHRVKALMFLGDSEGAFAEDLRVPILDRWGQGWNNLIEDNPVNLQQLVSQVDYKNKMAWVIALLSLMNYDYFVEEPQVSDPQGVKVKRDFTPHDSHYRVKLLLPKTKGRVIVPKQPKRQESYGVRLHDVAGHKRHYRDANGIVYKVVNIPPHQRGNAKLGVITKDYVVEKETSDD